MGNLERSHTSGFFHVLSVNWSIFADVILSFLFVFYVEHCKKLKIHTEFDWLASKTTSFLIERETGFFGGQFLALFMVQF